MAQRKCTGDVRVCLHSFFTFVKTIEKCFPLEKVCTSHCLYFFAVSLLFLEEEQMMECSVKTR